MNTEQHIAVKATASKLASDFERMFKISPKTEVTKATPNDNLRKAFANELVKSLNHVSDGLM